MHSFIDDELLMVILAIGCARSSARRGEEGSSFKPTGVEENLRVST